MKKTNKCDNIEIIGWENVSIADPIDIIKYKCTLCSAKPLYDVNSKVYCFKHSPLPPLCDLSGNKMKKIPDMKELKQILTNKNIDIKGLKSKSDLINEISDICQQLYTGGIIDINVYRSLIDGINDESHID